MKIVTYLVIGMIIFTAEAVSQNASKAVEAYNRGLQLQEAGDEANALLAYDIAIAANPKMADAYNNRATIKLCAAIQTAPSPTCPKL